MTTGHPPKPSCAPANVSLLASPDGRFAIRLALIAWFNHMLSWQEADCVKSVMRWLYRHERTGESPSEYLTEIVRDGVRAAIAYEAHEAVSAHVLEKIEELPNVLRGKSTAAREAAQLADERDDWLQATRYKQAAKQWEFAASHAELLLLAAQYPSGEVPSDAADSVAGARTELDRQLQEIRRYREYEASQR